MIFFFRLISFHFLAIIAFFAFTLLLTIIIINKDKAILIILHPYFPDPNLHILLKKKITKKY